MDLSTGRPNHIEDYLVTVRTGQWFGWSNFKNKIYANLVVHDGGSKPTEADCTNGLKALQDAWDLENDSYKSKRRAEYPQLAEQFDLLYKDIVAGTVTTNGDFAKAIKAVKDKYTKE
tara:strand:- start:48 stop:398 length:351 start_codon:yes stop_codon:yes gene_type:complete